MMRKATLRQPSTIPVQAAQRPLRAPSAALMSFERLPSDPDGWDAGEDVEEEAEQAEGERRSGPSVDGVWCHVRVVVEVDPGMGPGRVVAERCTTGVLKVVTHAHAPCADRMPRMYVRRGSACRAQRPPHRQMRAPSAACETSHGVRTSSNVGVEGGPRGVFVVGRVGLEAAVEDADESVGELAQGGVVVLASVAELVVVAAGGW